MRIAAANGDVKIADDVFLSICGHAATNCFGVKGMASRGDGIVRLLRKDNLSKGVKIIPCESEGKIAIELHIAVEYGVNLPAVCESIISEVRYNVERLTGVPVGSVDVFVDSVHCGP
ncbi:MAG: Asp23/Gls24 family envelope stress response protein [Oscillospiraceae bacterium]|jgi:uncharacterized alkaline shock family protein YloU|nr:Asp23/Gls24 family envelope stress response protein [Oscillospiraceae bacterium]